MGALGRLQPAEGIAAMQSINRVILNPLFLTNFIAAPAGRLRLVVLTSLWRWSEPGAAWLIAGSAYIVGTFRDVVFNVPMNNALDAVHPAAAEAGALWTRYLADWTAWNHVRTAASPAAAAFSPSASISARAAHQRTDHGNSGCGPLLAGAAL